MKSLARIAAALILAATLLAVSHSAMACGDGEPKPAAVVVEKETGIGTRCGRLYLYGPFKITAAAQAWVVRQKHDDMTSYSLRNLCTPE
jgi:hypothetical protein